MTDNPSYEATNLVAATRKNKLGERKWEGEIRSSTIRQEQEENYPKRERKREKERKASTDKEGIAQQREQEEKSNKVTVATLVRA